VSGTFLGTQGAFLARPDQKPEGKRVKATVVLTVAFIDEAVGKTSST